MAVTELSVGVVDGLHPQEEVTECVLGGLLQEVDVGVEEVLGSALVTSVKGSVETVRDSVLNLAPIATKG
jgi:hypothetical protein